jgi:hypothetical protein
MDEGELIEKLKRIQALYLGATTPGERIAAEKAIDRVSMRLDQHKYEQPEEYKFTMADGFQRRLFLALVRKHGLAPYRLKRQRYTTVMVRCSPRFVDEVLWPQYERLSETLEGYLADVTARVIRDAVHGDASEAAEAKELEG